MLALLALLQVEVGASSSDITPPGAYFMAGYFHERKNTGVRDPLQAKALVFREGAEAGALVMLDVVSVHPELVAQRLRLRVDPEQEPAEDAPEPASHAFPPLRVKACMKNPSEDPGPRKPPSPASNSGCARRKPSTISVVSALRNVHTPNTSRPPGATSSE